MNKLKMLPLNNFPILIQGETGTGKSLYAKNYFEFYQDHFLQFSQVNISSLNKNLFESEIFGHKRGAFTGAEKDKIGFCEKVGKGVLFLDEIGELSLEQQAKLLTLIDERTYYSVGSSECKKFYGKLIFATNRDLQQLVYEKKFREDLYYRIRFYQVRTMALREFSDLQRVIKKLAGEYDLILNQNSFNIFMSYDWPGNYRELKQTFLYLKSLDLKLITQHDIPEWLQIKQKITSERAFDFNENKRRFEKQFLKKALRLNGGRINQTSEFINLNKVTLISKLKKYGIDKEDFKLKINTESIASGF